MLFQFFTFRNTVSILINQNKRRHYSNVHINFPNIHFLIPAQPFRSNSVPFIHASGAVSPITYLPVQK